MEADYTLLETTLAMFNAEKYLPNFKKFGVDSTTLTLLTDEDLKVIGVVEEELRSKFIKQCSNLPLLLDSRLDLTVNEKYLMIALHQVDQHLLMLDASLTYALKRKNIQMCDVKLSKASKCLISCTNSLQNELINFHHIFSPKKKNEVNRRKIALLCITSAAATALVFKSLSAIEARHKIKEDLNQSPNESNVEYLGALQSTLASFRRSFSISRFETSGGHQNPSESWVDSSNGIFGQIRRPIDGLDDKSDQWL